MALYFSYKKGILLNLQTILTNSKIIITKKTNSTKKTNYNKITKNKINVYKNNQQKI